MLRLLSTILFQSCIAQLEIPPKIIYVKEGDNQRISCDIPDSRKLLRVSTDKRILFIKINGSLTTPVGRGSDTWKLLDDKKENFSINLELTSMSPDKVVVISCENDSGDTIKYDIRLQLPPIISSDDTSEYPLSVGSLLQLGCNAEGGAPLPSIRWEFSNQRAFNTSSTTDVRGKLISSLSASLLKSDNGVNVACHAQQNGVTVSSIDFGTIAVHYPPKEVDFESKTSMLEGELLQAKCTVDANPQPEIGYQIALKASDFWNALDITKPFTMLMDQSKVRCVVTGDNYELKSGFDMISILTKVKATKPPTTTKTPTTSTTTTTALTTTKESMKQLMKKENGTVAPTAENPSTTEDNLTGKVTKAGPRGIILSIIGVSCFLGFVIFLFFIRRCLKDRQGDSYKTDENHPEEVVSLHDPELEAHKKKEYFM